jgi:hypothetical protein
MQVNVWSLRFQKGEEYGAGPKMIDADLTLQPGDPGRVTGTIRNLTDRPLRNLQVILAGHSSPDMDGVAGPANGTTTIDLNLTLKRERGAKVAVPQFGIGDPGEDVAADGGTAAGAADGLAANRARQFDRRLEAGGHAIVLAEQDGAAPAVRLKEGASAIQRHIKVIRALVPLRQQKSPPPAAPK